MYVLTDEARQFVGLEDEPNMRIRVVLNLAERTVTRLAPPPTQGDDESSEDFALREADHTEKTHDASLFVFEYLWRTKGYITQEQMMSRSLNYDKDKQITDIVSGTMPEYYVPSADTTGGTAFRIRKMERA